MAEDLALAAALSLHQPGWAPPDTSAFMRRERAELVDIERDDEADDFTVDDSIGPGHQPSGTPKPLGNDSTSER